MTTIKNYNQAAQFLGSKYERPFANNTRIERHEDGSIMAKYHGNIVADFYPDCTSYSSCGWKTITTKQRLNWFLPEGFSLWQDKSIWYLHNRNTSERWIFADGLVIDKNGIVSNAANFFEVEKTQKLIKQIKIYANGWVKSFLNGNVPAPSGGDCWYCVMKTEDGQSLGEATHNIDHLYSHLEEKYYVPSLLMNAIKRYPMCQMSEGMFYFFWNEECNESPSDWHKEIFTRDATKSIIRYMKHEFGIAE